MKTLFVIIIATCIFSTTVYSQNLGIGPSKGFGPGIVSVSGNSAGDLDNRFFPSFNIGGKLVYSFVTNWGVSAGVNFSREGGRMEGNLGGPNEYEYIYRADYIRVPLQGIYFFGKLGDRVRPKLAVGPSFGFLIGGTSSFENNETGKTEVKTKDLFEPFDLGVIGSAGLNVRIVEDIWVNGDISYYHGLTEMNSSGPGSFMNRNLQMNVGIMFPIGTVKPK